MNRWIAVQKNKRKKVLNSSDLNLQNQNPYPLLPNLLNIQSIPFPPNKPKLPKQIGFGGFSSL